MIVPRWASSLAALLCIYVVGIVAAALWLPHEWDWAVWDYMSSRHAPAFDADEISIVDVPWDPANVAIDRRRIATFLTELVSSGQKPAAVFLDVQFGPCQSEPCGQPMDAARIALVHAIQAATAASLSVYAAEQPRLHADDSATGLEPHDAQIYAALSGAAHTKFTAVSNPPALFYRACYNVPVAGGLDATQPVWDVVQRVSMRAGAIETATCDTRHLPVRLPQDPVRAADAAVTKLDRDGRFPVTSSFSKKYVIVGTVEQDRPLDTPLGGPELVAWALSNALAPGSAADAELAYDTEPQGPMLLWLVPGFSAITIAVFIAVFFLARRLRLGPVRQVLPWMAAAVAALAGLAALTAFEGWLLASGHIQPQITLIAFGVLLAALLCGVRAFQFLFDETWAIDANPAETYDYDVFISYAHEEGAWVFEHIYSPLREAQLPGGRKLNIFFDKESIRYGTAWQEKITLAIDGSRFVVPVYSETYFRRPYCRFEIMRAHLKWINAGTTSRSVLPIMRGKPTIPATVADIQAVSINEVPDLVERVVAEITERLSRLDESVRAHTATEAPAT